MANVLLCENDRNAVIGDEVIRDCVTCHNLLLCIRAISSYKIALAVSLIKPGTTVLLQVLRYNYLSYCQYRRSPILLRSFVVHCTWSTDWSTVLTTVVPRTVDIIPHIDCIILIPYHFVLEYDSDARRARTDTRASFGNVPRSNYYLLRTVVQLQSTPYSSTRPAI